MVAKTKVAPIKPLTMPQLQLCGAVIMARLLNRVAKIFNIKANDTFAWTDSPVVLGGYWAIQGGLKLSWGIA